MWYGTISNFRKFDGPSVEVWACLEQAWLVSPGLLWSKPMVHQMARVSGQGLRTTASIQFAASLLVSGIESVHF